MHHFVNIRSVFDPAHRSVEALAKLYQDHGFLNTVIESVAQDVLTSNTLKGKRILLKPNWVRHNKLQSDNICLRTHDAFVLSVLETVLKNAPRTVVIGDAPIQGCHWSKVVTDKFLQAVSILEEEYTVPVAIKDFRRVAFDPALNNAVEIRRPLEEYAIFDVGDASFLEPITSKKKNSFRVTLYNPDQFIESHSEGMHKYCITKEVFDADVILSIPKVKTHQKTGITGALKNVVGINGDKDFLPHHRIGGTGMGGDCYPGSNRLRYMAELAYDEANRHKGTFQFRFWTKIASLFWQLSFPGQYDDPGAAWFGNDTCWRMVMDLNKIVNFGTADNNIALSQQREIFSLSDGIVGGQGNGPLHPDPFPLGIVSFSNSSALNDICMAHLMGMNVYKIPLLMAAKILLKSDTTEIRFNGSEIDVGELARYSLPAVMPPGWIGYDKI